MRSDNSILIRVAVLPAHILSSIVLVCMCADLLRRGNPTADPSPQATLRGAVACTTLHVLVVVTEITVVVKAVRELGELDAERRAVVYN
jgi:hypothetical protein